jgi:small-conductance mechanosensitive channel/CRP-like cAMP-binding protein
MRLGGMEIGWLVGAVIGIAGAVLGFLLVRALFRRRAGWWRAVAAPLILFGPAVGLILGSALAGGPWTFGDGIAHAPANVGWSVLLFVGATAVYALVRAFLTSRLVTEELRLRIPTLILDAGRWLVWLAALFVVVGVVWGRTSWFTGLLTASAIGTVIIGLALQETLQNFFAGISIVTEGIYAIGDWVVLDKDEGEVVEITRRTTRLRTRSGDLVTIPNRSIVGSRVRNLSRPTPLHAENLVVPAPYDVPPSRVRDALRAAMRDVPGALDNPAPALRLQKYGDSGIDYEVRFWLTDVARIPDIRSDANAAIWYHFARAGIAFPFPVRELRRAAAAAPPSTEQERARVRHRLESVPFFRSLPAPLLDGLAQGATSETFGVHERIVGQGEPGDSCYVIDAGTAEVTVREGDAERRVATLAAGDLFGEMSLLTGEPRSATVRTLSDVRLVRMGADSIRAALQASPDLAHALAEAAALRREGLHEARVGLDTEARARVADRTRKLSLLIRRFFHLGV